MTTAAVGKKKVEGVTLDFNMHNLTGLTKSLRKNIHKSLNFHIIYASRRKQAVISCVDLHVSLPMPVGYFGNAVNSIHLHGNYMVLFIKRPGGQRS